MKRFLITLLFICISTLSFAQNSKVTLTVIDAATQQGIAGAVVGVAPADDPDNEDKTRYSTSGHNGATTILGIKRGDYKIKISFLGYADKVVDLKANAATVDLGKIALEEEATKIETVVKTVQAIRASQKGDTIAYNADAFKVANDADVEGLLKKMPGITVSDGQVEAQGETVKKILVDGKEFFGEDVATALNSLPAQSVKSIEVYNKLSDNAEFSGVDDGESYKAINIVTHENMRQGVFGKVYAGYGYQPDTDEITEHNKYMVGGNVNYFHGSSRISLIGMLNNVNQQNFSFEDILGVSGEGGGGGMGRRQRGLANVGSIGLNYSDSWGEKEKVKLQASYFYNQTRTRNLSELIKWYEAPLEELGTLEQEGHSDNRNYNHRLNARLDWRISDKQSLMSRTNLSFQQHNPFSRTDGLQVGPDPENPDNLYDIVRSGSEGDNGGYNFSEFLQYRLKLGKNGRFITADARINHRDNNNESRSFSTQQTLKDEAGVYYPLLRHLSNLSDSENTGVSASLNYTEPLGKTTQLSLRYNFDYNTRKSIKETTNYGDDDTYTNGVIDNLLSNRFQSDNTRHNIGPRFNWNKGGNVLVLSLEYQHSTLNGFIQSSKDVNVKRDYNDFTYFLMGNFNINQQNSIRLFVRSNTTNPDIRQLNSILDVSNAQYVSRGNEKLNPTYSHNVMFHYNHTNLEKGRTFMWMMMFNKSKNSIASSMYTGNNITDEMIPELVGSNRPIQYSTYENVKDGTMNIGTNLSFGLPLNFMKCNFNISGGVHYSQTPSLVNGLVNTASNIGYNARVVLGSNISENIDFTLSWHGGYNQAKNSLASKGGANEYFNHSATGTFKAVFLGGFTFTASANYVQNIGFTNDYNTDYTLVNAYIGRKVFKSRLGEVMVGVNDLLNQNTAFSRTTGSGFTQNSWNSVIGRYFTAQFNYNLRVFGKKGSRVLSDYGISEGGNNRGGNRGGFGGPGGGRGPGMGGPGGFGGPGMGGGRPRF